MFEYKAVYIRNFDGDTITFLIDLGFKVKYETNIRLKGVDTPELRSKDSVEKARAYEAKAFVMEKLIYAKEIIIKTDKDKTGKYGRYIAEVIYDGKNLNQELVEAQLAEVYE